jgi:hypothetical protein
VLVAVAALVVCLTALAAHVASSSTASLEALDALVGASRSTTAADRHETALAREARQAAAQRAASEAARARAVQATAAARAAERRAAQLAEAHTAAAQQAARRGAQAKARALARAKAAQAAKARAARSAVRAASDVAPARTSWPALNQAIAAIPGYRDGIARWHVTSRSGHYGITDANQPGAANIYISPTVPASKLYSVAAHEYGHAVVIANYGTGYGPYTQYSRDMVRWFGGTTVTGLERAADCIALRLGATWTNYTGCGDAHWQEGARILLRGGTL